MRELVCALGGCQGWGSFPAPAPRGAGGQEGCEQGMRTSSAGYPQYSLCPECEKGESAAGLRWELSHLRD